MEYGPLKAYCPVCGKFFVTMWREHWIHRRGETYYCSEDCLMVDLTRDTKLMNEAIRRSINRKGLTKMNGKITLEMKKRAVDIAISGKSPLEYLKTCGAKNPSASWTYIKKCLEKTDPEKFARLQGGKKETPEEDKLLGKVASVKIETHKMITDPDVDAKLPEKITVPVSCMGMMVREVEGLFGRYRRSDVGGAIYIDFENTEGLETLSMTIDQWKSFRDEQVKAAEILGVEL